MSKRGEISIGDEVTINGCTHYKAKDKYLSNIRYLAGMWMGHICQGKKVAELRAQLDEAKDLLEAAASHLGEECWDHGDPDKWPPDVAARCGSCRRAVAAHGVGITIRAFLEKLP